MKNKDHILTFQETEQLCRLYMECRLSVYEETELQYVLGNLDYSSILIDEVRILMGIQSAVAKNSIRIYKNKFIRSWKSPYLYNIVATATILIGLCFFIYLGISTNSTNADSSYIAYANGVRLNDRQAIIQIDTDMKKAEEFMSKIAEFESQEQIMINNFFNNKPFNQ